jgi:hypothetical protein
MDQLIAQYRFTIERDGYTLQDALVMPMEDYQKLTPEEIESQKEQRFTNWVDHIQHPPVQPELSKEEQLAEVEKQLQSIEEQKQVLTSQKAQLVTAISEQPIEEPVEEIGK